MIPGARYRFLPRTFTFAGLSTEVDLEHLVLELGFAGRF
jgi:hypothetical protein